MMKQLKTKLAIAASAFGLLAAGAHAALPAEATAALTAATTATSDASAGVWPVIGAVLVAGITIKLVKRFANKI